MNTSQIGRRTGGVNEAVAAAGNSQATGTLLGAGLSVVTSSTASTAIALRLPTDVAVSDTVEVVNTTANTLSIYPQTAGTINGLSANAAITVAANKTALLRNIGALAGVPRWTALVG